MFIFILIVSVLDDIFFFVVDELLLLKDVVDVDIEILKIVKKGFSFREMVLF